MSVTLYESVRSRGLEVTNTGGGFTLEFVAQGSDDFNEVYLAVLLETTPVLFGLIRKRITLNRQGAALYFPEVVYEPGQVGDAIFPEGTPGEPQSAPGADDPLDSNVTGTTGGGTAHIVLSKETFHAVPTPPFVAPATERAIGLTRDAVEGCDIATAAPEFSVTRKRRTMTLTYLRTLGKLTGKVNGETFWGFAPNELLYLGADYSGSNLSGWSVTHKFRYDENVEAGDPRLVITPSLTLPSKPGHHYVWCSFRDRVDAAAGELYPLPICAFVERVYDRGIFANLEIGT